MRFKLIVASAAALLFAGTQLPAEAQTTPGFAPAVNAVSMVQQTQPPGGTDIDVQIGDDDAAVWYTNPVWIAVGLLAIIVVGLIIGMAARGGGGGGSTIVK
jgi:hypothetical protein